MSISHNYNIRKSAVAGMFYPKNSRQLRESIRNYLDVHPQKKSVNPKILIVPHAGYIYSGLAAGAGYRQIQNYSEHIENVVIIGPSHHKYLEIIAYPTEDQFETPLGRIDINHRIINEFQKSHKLLKSNSLVHLNEHCLEVQLPFLQYILSDFKIIPLLMGNISATDTSALIASILEYENILVIITTDLSHYLSYDDSVIRDNETAEKIEKYQLNTSGDNIACGIHPLTGALMYAKESNLEIKRLSLMNSGDTAGSRDQVVGYGSWMIYDPIKKVI